MHFDQVTVNVVNSNGTETLVLYTRGTKGTISEELRQFLNYMENTDQSNAVNEDLKDIQKMIDTVKRDVQTKHRSALIWHRAGLGN